ncbi:hypothetical protein [Halomonas stenophila]|uniref:Uncharacterized protein n=1 Tax=Halomonas stenophila TaxID=795312 RepID=A0A7W5EUI8_9GAMM|nr:hypothetical protein [Halomonas stenophila]MBB3231636.1 hypothetical protein [Halomonas stenophila]
MAIDRPRLHYTCIFLHVSFRAIRQSVDEGPGGDASPCWLDTGSIRMLLGEMHRCRVEAASQADLCRALDGAISHVGLLLLQCPGGLDRGHCRRHLDAIITPLGHATRLAMPRPAPRGHWQGSARRLFRRLGLG